jgi:hypothetical protein
MALFRLDSPINKNFTELLPKFHGVEVEPCEHRQNSLLGVEEPNFFAKLIFELALEQQSRSMDRIPNFGF